MDHRTGPLSFSAAGTVVQTSWASVTATGNYTGKDTATNRTQMITTAHYADEYRSWTSPSTPPANPAYWPVVGVMTVPGAWLRDALIAVAMLDLGGLCPPLPDRAAA